MIGLCVSKSRPGNDRRYRRRIMVVLAGVAVLATACAGSTINPGAAGTRTVHAPLRLCGARTAAPRHYQHVLWIFFENQPYNAVIGAAPYTTAVAAACGLATNYYGVSHPSLPNYIAATSGSTQGITDDAGPDQHQLRTASIFSQAGSWRAYEEGMPGRCDLSDDGRYAVRHDPAVYYQSLRANCRSRVMPLGSATSGALAHDLARNTLPRFGFVTPDLCNDTHDCPVAVGDAWLARWMPRITRSSAYRSGQLAVLIVWDEDDGSADNHVPLIVIAASVRRGARTAMRLDHYALLRTTEDLLGASHLGQAARAGSFRRAFGL